MADSIRKKIFKNIEGSSTLGAIASLKTVVFGTFEPEDVANKPTKPVAGIIPEEDVGESGAKSVSRNELRLFVRIVVDKGADHAGYQLEDEIANIKTKMMVDVTRGGNAMDTKWIKDRWLYLDRDFPQAGADIEYQIDYKSKIEDPTLPPG